MTITLHWWMWFALPAAIFIFGWVWSDRSARNDSGLSAGFEALLIFLGFCVPALVLAIGILIGHYA